MMTTCALIRVLEALNLYNKQNRDERKNTVGTCPAFELLSYFK